MKKLLSSVIHILLKDNIQVLDILNEYLMLVYYKDINMLIQSVYKRTKKLAKSENISIEEAIEKIIKFEKDLVKFKSRIGLIEKLEINAPRYKSDPKPEGYLLLTTKKEILKHILNVKEYCKSYRVTFKDGSYYYVNDNGSQYTTNYNSVIVNFLTKYI